MTYEWAHHDLIQRKCLEIAVSSLVAGPYNLNHNVYQQKCMWPVVLWVHIGDANDNTVMES